MTGTIHKAQADLRRADTDAYYAMHFYQQTGSEADLELWRAARRRQEEAAGDLRRLSAVRTAPEPAPRS